MRLVEEVGTGDGTQGDQVRQSAVSLDEAERRLDETWDDLFTYNEVAGV